MTSSGDWGPIIDKAEAERFVGRERELDIFRQEISRTQPRYFIFYITGQGGVGKTTLLNRYREIAKDSGFLLADSDEQQRDIPAVLGRFAHQLAEQGFPLKHFDARYKNYRQKRNEIENDPKAPPGLAALLGRTIVRAAFIGGDLVPGVRKGLELVPRDSLETQASEWTDYLSKKLTSKDEIALVRDPISILTPLFFDDLNEHAQKRQVLLCFENFETTRQELQDWLLRLREYKPSQNIRIVIAGRDQPGVNWDTLRSVTITIHLDVLSEQEAEIFLDTYGITNAKRRTEILEYSGRLPVIMSLLAAPEGNEPYTSIPTQDIVERFLRWVAEPSLRQVALLAAIPRTFNLDILKLLLKNQDQPTIDEQHAFDWLLTMPFAKPHSDGWRYHDVVRRMMLQYQHQKSPQTYRQLHTVLANFYHGNYQLSPSHEELWSNEQWRKNALAYAYHYLVADPTQHWAKVISLFALAVRKRRSFAVEMIGLLSLDDIRDELSPEQNSTIELFRQKLQAMREGNLQDGLEMFDKLCEIDNLSPGAKGHALAYRAECYRLKGELEKALSDFNAALEYIPKDARTITRRGIVFILMGRDEESLEDLDKAIDLDKQEAWPIAIRGEAYRRMGRYRVALTDLNRAIALDGKLAWAFAIRGETYREMRLYQEALVDFDHAIALNEKDTWAINRRELAKQELQLYQEDQANVNKPDLPEPSIPQPPQIPSWQYPSQQAYYSPSNYPPPPIVYSPSPLSPTIPSPPSPNTPWPYPPPTPPIQPKRKSLFPPLTRQRIVVCIAILVVLVLAGLALLTFFHIP